MTDIERLFTANASAYHRFIGLFRYSSGLRALVDRGGYLRDGMRVLDAGCGTGAFTRAVHEVAVRRSLTLHHHAFDLTPAMMAHLEAWGAEVGVPVALCRANVLDLGELPESWQGFDLVVSSAMLEYLPPDQLRVALRNLAGRLAPGGVLLVCISRRNLLMRALIEAWWKSFLYSRAEVALAFEEAGLMARFGHFPLPYRYLDVWGHVVEARSR